MILYTCSLLSGTFNFTMVNNNCSTHTHTVYFKITFWRPTEFWLSFDFIGSSGLCKLFYHFKWPLYYFVEQMWSSLYLKGNCSMANYSFRARDMLTQCLNIALNIHPSGSKQMKYYMDWIGNNKHVSLDEINLLMKKYHCWRW